MQGLTVFYIIILIVSVILHELAHGYAAYSQGDKTALFAGRLTLNPLPHLDLWGSVLIPFFLVISGVGFVIGWAKPVPYNPNNLRDPVWGEVLVASAGILTNLLIAIVFSVFIRFLPLSETMISLSQIVVVTNIVLAVFNLVPIPPLDGSKILFALIPARFVSFQAFFEKYSLVILLVFIFYGWRLIEPIILGLFRIFTGGSF